MKTPLLIAASTLALAGCSQGASYSVAKLQCPATEGDLTRTGVSDGGKACAYRSSDGAEVSLELVPVKDSPEATLARIETELRSTPGPLSPEAAADQADTARTIADAAAAKATMSAVAAEVARVQAEAAADAGIGSSDHGQDEPRDSAQINLPGVHISADDSTANVRIGPIKVDASGEDAIVNVYRDVRMRGEALSTKKRGVRASFIYTGKDLPAGYRYIGYEAGGPKTGPLTVARIRSKTDTESGDRIQHDVQELVRRNGGV